MAASTRKAIIRDFLNFLFVWCCCFESAAIEESWGLPSAAGKIGAGGGGKWPGGSFWLVGEIGSGSSVESPGAGGTTPMILGHIFSLSDDTTGVVRTATAPTEMDISCINGAFALDPTTIIRAW